MLLRRIDVGQKYPHTHTHTHMLSISTCKNQSTKACSIYIPT